ncbi:MAG TPA: FHA domain-containing serine/threonine-protein kinase [Candidatus Brocadiia bacterium]|nr:FHA domain-containing serine/threonine-protein kinase [Candidatus Brocadiia bacterium]
MIVRLVVVKGQDEGNIYSIPPGVSKIIGRSSKTDIVLRDVGISRLHCRVRNDGLQAFIKDMNSKNGTTVNQRRIQETLALANKDRVELGASVLEVRIENGTEDQPAPKPPARALVEEEAAPLFEIAKPEPPPQPQPSAQPAQEESPAEILGSFEAWLKPSDLKAEAAPAPEPEQPGIEAEPPEPPPAAQAPLLLDTPEDLQKTPLPPSGIEATPEPAIGSVIGGCRIEERLGRDDISRIYRGVQVSMERPVTIKILDPRGARDERAVQRFLSAARSCGRLSHPNIVQVYDAGVDQGFNFIVLEFVEGQSLQDLLVKQGQGRPLPLNQALDTAAQILDALAHAHSLGVIHRNITPSNIHVTRHNIAKLAGLGFARCLDESGLRRVTRQGEAIGDLCFAAPEQLADASSAGPLADIYSMGAVLYVTLTGRLPHRAQERAQLLAQVRSSPPEPIRRLNPAVPVDVAQVVLRAMNPDPRSRFASAADMQAALRAARQSAP